MKNSNFFKLDSIAAIFLSTAVVMIVTEITGVVAVLSDGIITSHFLGVNAYSGISLMRPFTGVVMMIAGFFPRAAASSS